MTIISTAPYKGRPEYWHTGNGKFVARNDYHSTIFTPPVNTTPLQVWECARTAITKATGGK